MNRTGVRDRDPRVRARLAPGRVSFSWKDTPAHSDFIARRELYCRDSEGSQAVAERSCIHSSFLIASSCDINANSVPLPGRGARSRRRPRLVHCRTGRTGWGCRSDGWPIGNGRILLKNSEIIGL
jgi:hypothetical protein